MNSGIGSSRYFNRLRVAAYLLVLYCVGHSWGALLAAPRFGAPGDAVLAAMKSAHFRCQAADCTWYGFYLGFGWMVSIFLLLSAGMAWFLGGLGPRERAALRPLTWMLFVSHAVGAVLAWTYFFVAPGVFATAVALLLGWECVTGVRADQSPGVAR
ncbi:MAG TPA: hypothetical protein VH137_00305 [Gemmatimonadales bacterium]|jgi:hypothetical protein|nr:hypothetical protein [Gemmatimonadales bacterium]